jgi:glycosyltransferase involved in cell wall biosynthesis
MGKLLTISIPTYNRATLLDRQLAWLAHAVRGHEADCDVLVCDNCSTDETPGVVGKWQAALGDILTSRRNATNIGLVPNVARCYTLAAGRFAWTIGDDDPIEDGALAYVLQNIKEHPELAYLNLNSRWYDEPNRTVVDERYFDIEREEVGLDGKAVIEGYLTHRFSGLAFLTAQVYRTEAIQEALRSWPGSVDNWEGPVYWVAFCALRGAVKFSRHVYVTYTCGTNDLAAPRFFFKVRYDHLPRMYVKLQEIGYDPDLCRRAILGLLTGEGRLRTILGALRRWPVFATPIVASYLALAARTHLSSPPAKALARTAQSSRKTASG